MKLSDDDFSLFGLPARHALDRAELDARRRDLQSRVHPDRFASEDAAAQRLAMQWAVARERGPTSALKDPLSRAAYFVRAAGCAGGCRAQHGHAGGISDAADAMA